MSSCTDNMFKQNFARATPVAKHDCCMCNRTQLISHTTNQWSIVVLPTVPPGYSSGDDPSSATQVIVVSRKTRRNTYVDLPAARPARRSTRVRRQRNIRFRTSISYVTVHEYVRRNLSQELPLMQNMVKWNILLTSCSTESVHGQTNRNTYPEKQKQKQKQKSESGQQQT